MKKGKLYSAWWKRSQRDSGGSTNKKRNHLNQRVKRPDYKVAYVQLGPGVQVAFDAEPLPYCPLFPGSQSGLVFSVSRGQGVGFNYQTYYRKHSAKWRVERDPIRTAAGPYRVDVC
ncbi:hypothetical protein JZ751_020838 [Albula glossodonta]|uniref:Uncharacterized protein n=1 Tax=Albula glossodonta TaxID=121402 RepID=A0A8T2PIR3_9TELE|nr:hypothetical protein JZ751_020838 [Albula glossodonta]